MLTKEIKTKLTAKGFDVDKFIAAIKDENEVEVTLPELFTEAEKKQYGDNRAKKEQGIVREIVAKEIAKKFDIEADTKDPFKIVEAVAEKRIADAKLPIDDKLKEAKATIESLQSKFQKAEDAAAAIKAEYDNKMFENSLRQKALSIIPETTTIPKADLVDLFFLHSKVEKDDEGTLITTLNGKKLIDKLENPVPFEQAAKGFFEQYVKQAGGGDHHSSTPPDKFSKLSDVAKWAKDNNIVVNSDEFNKVLMDKKADNFEFDEIPEKYL